MATMNGVIEYVDSLKPNVYTEEDKYKWINQLEGRISIEVHNDEEVLMHKIPDDADKELSVPAPFDDVYSLYVSSMIDFHNKEWGNYNNTTLMFNERLEAYKKYYIQRNAYGKAKNFRNVMG